MTREAGYVKKRPYELLNLDTVVRIAKETAENMSIEFAGALLRPHAFLLSKGGKRADAVLRAASEAGRELVSKGRIPKRLLEAVAKPLVSEKEFMEPHA